jgi:hypothetical protein
MVKNPIVKTLLAAILKGKADIFMDPKSNGCMKKTDEWEREWPAAVVKWFDTDDDLGWKRNRKNFTGMWMHVTRNEQKDFFSTESDYMITENLQRLDDAKIIERWHSKTTLPNGTIVTDMWICLNIDRYLELCQQAYDMALKHHLYSRILKAKRTYKTKAKKEESTGSLDEISSSETDVKRSANSSSSLTLVPESLENKTKNTSGRSVIIYSEDNSQFPADFEAHEFSENTALVLSELQSSGRFPLKHFTFPVLKRIEYWAAYAVPGHRMTPENIKQWLALCQNWSESGGWQFEVTDLKFFISRWIAILRKTRSVLCQQEAMHGQMLLEECNKEAVLSNLHHEFDFMTMVVNGNADSIVRDGDGDVVRFIVEGQIANTCMGGRINLLSQLIYFKNLGVDIQDLLAQKWEQLKSDLMAVPTWFYFLEKLFPLAEWAHLTKEGCEYLRNKALSIYENVQRSAALAASAAL